MEEEYKLTLSELKHIYNALTFGIPSDFRIKQEIDFLKNKCCDNPEFFTSYNDEYRIISCTNCDHKTTIVYYDEDEEI
jgi:hypothetical protein